MAFTELNGVANKAKDCLKKEIDTFSTDPSKVASVLVNGPLGLATSLVKEAAVLSGCMANKLPAKPKDKADIPTGIPLVEGLLRKPE